ncbi:MAG TPA: SAF domain-containing protein [Acidimicrobiales bacterium]|jgi:Flp pilus assembly protein CpaB
MRLPARRPIHRLRLRLATRPLAYWTLAAVVAGGTGLIVQRVSASAAEARRQWGESVPTLVALRPLAVGDTLDATNVEVRAIPVGVRPETALDALPAPGRLVAAPVARNEIVTAARLGRADRSSLAGLLPAGTRGIAVPVPPGAVPLHAGDGVDVVGADLVVSSATVVHASDGAVVVAVAEADAPAVARAVADGQVSLVLDP